MGDIWQAARANNVPRVKALLERGVSPDATRWSGVTPLHRAAEVNSCQVAQVLINADASVNVRTSWGWYAPLHFALKRRQVAEVLLRAGARWTILTKRLQTPYDLAVARGLKIQALRIQDISRKISEERRILHKSAPTDASTSRGRRATEATAARRKQAKEHRVNMQRLQVTTEGKDE
ncbi:unnamed protein product, partial [Ectocarpus sp. 12 AP-2014]